MNRFMPGQIIGGFFVLTAFAGFVSAATLEMMTYYPPSGNLPNPFRVTRQTVGNGYMSTSAVPTDSLIVEGPLGIRTSNPDINFPVEVGPIDASNLGGAVRLLGAPSYRWFYLQNNTGQVRLITQDAAGSSEKLRILNNGRVGIFYNNLGVQDPRGPLELGPRDGNNLGGQLMFSGAGSNHYFHIENNQGRIHWTMQTGPSTEENRIRILNDGRMGIFTADGTADDASVLAALNIGPRNTSTNGGKVLWAGAGSQRYFHIENVSGDLRLVTQDTSGESAKLTVTDTGSVGIGTTAPLTRLHVAGKALFEGDIGSRGVDPATGPGINVHVHLTTGEGNGFLMEPDTTTSAIGVFAHNNSASVKTLRFGEASGSTVNGRIVMVGGQPANGIPGDPFETIPGNGQIGIRTDPSSGTFMFAVSGTTHATRVLIGSLTYTSGYELKVGGNAWSTATNGWENGSSAALKTDISRLTPIEENGILSELADLPLYRYQLKKGDGSQRQSIGILAEEAPEVVVSDSGEALSTADYLASLVAAVKAQQAQIELLRARIDTLKKKRIAARGGSV
ncbi:MAG: tail fiber domain-containing protein [Candidatus Omnitrophica bacterium]|nr:tail fiber domain-containing protein [Candidatus Omnitrophota bacterium]